MWSLPNFAVGYGWLIVAYIYAGLVCYLCAYTSNFYTKLVKRTKYPRLACIRGALFVILTWPIFGPFLLWIYSSNAIGRYRWRATQAIRNVGTWFREVYRQARPWKGKYEYYHYAAAEDDQPADPWYPAENPRNYSTFCTYEDAVAEGRREIGYSGPAIFICRLRVRLRKQEDGKRRWVEVPYDVTKVETRKAEPTVVS